MLNSYKKSERKLLHIIEEKSPGFLNEIFLVFTAFGSAHFSIILAGLLWELGSPRFGLLVIATTGLTWTAVNIMKYFIGRPRPGNSLTSLTRTSSFPSGHSANAFALAVILTEQISSLFFLPLLIASSVAISRVILRNHYPSDVLAGSMIGVLIGYLVLIL